MLIALLSLLLLSAVSADAACPEICQCFDLLVLCSAQNASRVPQSLHGRATAVDLAHNLIREIPDAAFAGLDALTKLDLSHNLIGEIPDAAFAGLDALTKLDLSHNLIGEIPDASFAGLDALTKLDLSHNLITALTSHSFSSLTNLRLLDLSFNNISVLPQDIFEDNTHLNELYLKRNAIILSSTRPIFASNSLRVLDLAYCELTHIPVITFASLSNIVSLDVYGNELVTLEAGAVRPLAKLSTLRLSDATVNCGDAAWRKTSALLASRGVKFAAHCESPARRVQPQRTVSTYDKSRLQSLLLLAGGACALVFLVAVYVTVVYRRLLKPYFHSLSKLENPTA